MIYSPPSIHPEITVLIPTYNAEPFLETCLASVQAQVQHSLEIVCIDDGSTDNSAEILDRMAHADPRVVVLHKDNSGYGDSLNQGLERARGDFVGIIESDDFADPLMYKKLFALATRYDAEIVKSDFYEHVNGVSRKANIIPRADADRLISPTEEFAIFRAQPSIWSAIYARTLLQKYDIDFTDTPGAAFQDTAFNLKTLAMSDKVWLTTEAFVHYRRDNEASSIHTNDKAFTVCDEYRSFEDFLRHYTERWKKIRRPIQAVKFETYSWNLSRLQGRTQKDFFEYMQRTFSSLQQDGLLDSADFAAEDLPLLELLLTDDHDFIQTSIHARTAKYANNDL